MIGISIRKDIGIGDALQFSSLPENYYRSTGQKLIDVSRPWFFDFNPFVVRDDEAKPSEVVELWNFPKIYEWPRPRETVYLSNAEIWASLFKVKAPLARPRLYRFEDFPFRERKAIFFQTTGKSHGELPDYVVHHVVKKYGSTNELYQIVGNKDDKDIGIPRIEPATLWDLAETLSRARMFIGPDSGPSWVAACYPDVVIKKTRIKWQHGYKESGDWVPLEIDHHHSHWDDRAFQIYNLSEDDLGFTQSYRKI